MGSISLNGINKSFGTTEVLKDINLDIKDGEFLILIGPSLSLIHISEPTRPY